MVGILGMLRFFPGKTVPLEDEHEVSMFKRIQEMRSKLEGIIQLQTIKYQVRNYSLHSL